MQDKTPRIQHLSAPTSGSRKTMPGGDLLQDLRQQCDKLKLENARLAFAANAAGAALWSFDLDTNIFWTNEKTRDLFQFPRTGEITIEHFVDKIHPDDISIIKDVMQKTLHEGEPLDVEYRITLPDGSIRWVQTHGALYSNPGEYSSCLMGASVDITDKKMYEQAINQQLRFETLLAEISTCFINLPTDQIDSVIEGAQRSICEFFDIERSTLWLTCKEKPGSLFLVHSHSLFLPPAESMCANDFFPWVTQKVLDGETVIISKMTDLPPDAGLDLESWRSYGTKSVVLVPLSVGDRPVFGLLTFGVMRKERIWTEAVVLGFKLIAQVFANALTRKNTDQALRSAIESLDMAAASANVGLWSLDLASGRIWLTDKTRQIFGFSSELELTLMRFLENVHVDDRARINAVIDEACRSGKEVSVDYRFVSSDGQARWMNSRGRLQVEDSAGLRRIMGVTLEVTERKQKEERLKEQLIQIEALKQRVELENDYLLAEVRSVQSYGAILGQSEPLMRVLAQVEQVAPTTASVLVSGETGTGKELIAHAIHDCSPRRGKLMVKVNCASLPSSLIESELFGRERGAYTGALTRQAGRFEVADGSSIFLDEISELPLDLQGKLLRVLQEGEFERLGSPKTIKVDLRVIAATNRDLLTEVKKGKFREDLYYRLNVFPIVVPPLRERLEDIPLLVWAFIREFNEKMGKKINKIAKHQMSSLLNYSWPGNIRELRNVIEHAAITSSGKELEVRLTEAGDAPPVDLPLEEVERCYIENILRKTGWNIKGSGGAAQILGMNAGTLYSRMKKLGIFPRRSKGGISSTT